MTESFQPLMQQINFRAIIRQDKLCCRRLLAYYLYDDSLSVLALIAQSCQQDEEQGPALSEEQQGVVDLVLAGRNVFFTGCAGRDLPNTS